MQNLLYNEINNNINDKINNNMKNIIKNDINYLKSFQIGGTGDINKIVSSLLVNNTTYEEMKNNIDIYIQRLTKLDKLIKGDGAEGNKGMLKTSEQLKPSSGDFQNIFDTSNNFGKFLSGYTDFLKGTLWNQDRLSLDNDATDQTDPTKYDIFFNKLPDDDISKSFKTQLNDFNEKLKIIYSPFITNGTKSLKDNIIANIDKIDEIIEISKKFNLYVQEKKVKLDEVLSTKFVPSDLKTIDNIPNGEKEKISFESIQLKQESALNMESIKTIENHINTISQNVQIIDNINTINEVNIFSAKLTESINLEKLLDVDDCIELIPKEITQKGGLDKEYYTFDSNIQITDLIKKIEYLFELLDNIFNNFEYMKELQYRYNFYIHYLFLVISESAKNPKMETYQYISKKTAQLYQKIFQNIKKGFTTIQQDDKELEYLNKYHYITIHKLIKLMDIIISNLNDTQYVDVNACTGNIYSDLIVFNHFRQIILKLSNTPNDKGKTILGLTEEELKGLKEL